MKNKNPTVRKLNLSVYLFSKYLLVLLSYFSESGTKSWNQVFGSWIVIGRHREIDPFTKTEVSFM